MEHHELLSGLVRLHVLHWAAEDDLYGNWMIEELGEARLQDKPRHALPDAARPRTQRRSHLTNGTGGSLATPHLPRNTLRHRGFRQ